MSTHVPFAALPTLVRAHRAATQTTQVEVARLAGISVATISRWERGGRDAPRSPDWRTVCALAAWLGVQVETLPVRESREAPCAKKRL